MSEKICDKCVMLRKRIKDLLNYYQDYSNRLYILYSCYDESENIKKERNEVVGRIKMLKELLKEFEEQGGDE